MTLHIFPELDTTLEILDPDAARPVGRTSITSGIEDDILIVELVDSPNSGQPMAVFSEHSLSFDVVPCETVRVEVAEFEIEFHRSKAVFDPSEHDCKVLAGDTYVRVDFPWSNLRVDRGVFKARYRNKRELITKKVLRAIDDFSMGGHADTLRAAAARAVLVERLSEVSYDPWESRREILTAALYGNESLRFGGTNPYKTRNLSKKQETGYRVSGRSRGSRSQQNACYLHAMVRNYNEVRSSLLGCDLLSSLLDRAEAGTLLSSQSPSTKAQRSQQLRAGTEAFKDVAEECMDVAIAQALGGPYSTDEYFQLVTDRRVDKLAAMVFRRHARNYITNENRQTASNGSSCQEPELNDDENVAEVRRSLEALSRDERKNVEIMEELGYSPADILDALRYCDLLD